MNNSLKSSIKAYCLELMKETSTSADAGGYLTKKAFRKPKKQDIKSPTGFESSPTPNMYTKTMKFKIVNPKDRLNSKDLWKEIKINKPVIKAKLNSGDKEDIIVYKRGVKWDDIPDQPFLPDFDNPEEVTWSLISVPEWKNQDKMWWNDDEIDFPNDINENTIPSYEDFPITISNYEKGQIVGDWLKKYGYKVDTTQPPFSQDEFKPFTLNSDLNKNIKILHEIKVNSPGQTQFPIIVNNKEELEQELSKLIKKGFQPDWKEYNGEYPINIFGDTSSYLFLSNHSGDNEKYNIKLSEIKVNNPLEPIEVGSDIEFDGREYTIDRYTDDGRVYIRDKVTKDLTWVKPNDLKRINEIKVNKPIDINQVKQDLKKELIWIKKNTLPRDRDQELEDLLSKYEKLLPSMSKQGIMDLIYESHYTQFKRKASQSKPREILHKAIKEIQMKLDEVNRLIEFTTRIKGELAEGEQEIEYLKRTKNSLYNIQEKLKTAFNSISKINEIKINNPTLNLEDIKQLLKGKSLKLGRLFMKYFPGFANIDVKSIPIEDHWNKLSPQDKINMYKDAVKLSNDEQIDEIKNI